MNRMAQIKHADMASYFQLRSGILQRKCDCGKKTTNSYECTECTNKKNTLHRQLSIGASNDPLEHEADRVADHVMRSYNPLPVSSTPIKISRLTGSGSITAASSPISVDKVLSSSGQLIEARVRQDMEQSFGHDFSQVRLYTGTSASNSASDINARAYTVGNNIVFGAGQYSPESNNGKRLLAHELTHVVQQASYNNSQIVNRQPASHTPLVNTALTQQMVERIAQRLYDAMDGLGTDEEAIYSLFSGRNQAQVNSIEIKYSEIYGRNLIDDLQDELTESEMRNLARFAPIPVANIRQNSTTIVGALEHVVRQLHDAMDGLGTDEDSIFAALTGRTETEIIEIKRIYSSLFSNTLEEDLNDELSGDDLRLAYNLLDRIDEATPHIFSGCFDESVRQEIRSYVPVANSKVQNAKAILANGWSSMSHSDQTKFSTYFDPARTGTVDDSFVERVNDNYSLIMSHMQSLSFDCDVDSGSLCGDGNKFCVNARLYWTCFGSIRICPNFTTVTDQNRKNRDIIHESVHNALHTTDRAYYGTSGFASLSPYGTGFLSVANDIPILGMGFRLIPGSDTLNNPDSYAHFAWIA